MDSRQNQESSQPDAQPPERSYLGTGVHALTTEAFRVMGQNDQQASSHTQVDQYATSLAKMVPLFLRDFGMIGTVAAYALDRAKPADSLQHQVMDLGLGGAEGFALRKTYDVLGRRNAPPALKGIALGTSSRAIDALTNRNNYYNSDGQFDLGTGARNVIAQAANPLALMTDAASFTVSEYAMGRLNYLTKGALYRNPVLPNLVTGGVFGATTGMGNEIIREAHDGKGYNFGTILTHGAIDATLGAAAAGPGAYQSYRANLLHPGMVESQLPASNSPEAQARVRDFNRLDEHQLRLQSGNLTIERQLNDIAYLGRVHGDDFSKPVVFRVLNEDTQPRFINESFAYKFNRSARLSNGALPLVERQATINGAPVNGWVQEMAGQSFEEGTRAAAASRYDMATDRGVARLLRSVPAYNNVLKDAWVERSIMNEWDNHSHNFLLRSMGAGGLRVPNIDYDLALPDARFKTDLIPGWGKTASRVSLLNARLVGQLADQPLSEPTRAGLSDFVSAFNTPAGRDALFAAGLRSAQIDGVLGRSQWYVENGRLPAAEWRNPFTYSALWYLYTRGGRNSLRYEEAAAQTPNG